jgi:hypothetical protein
MNFLSRKHSAHTNPQVEPTPVDVNVTATNRDDYYGHLCDCLAMADVVHTPEQIAAIQADQARRIKAMGGEVMMKTHWVISGFSFSSFWVPVGFVLGLFFKTQTKGSHYSTTPLLHLEGYHPLVRLRLTGRRA